MFFNTLNKNLLDLLHAKDHEVADIKKEIRVQEGKIQQMLLWSNISAIWSYLILVLVIVRLYGNLSGKNSFLLFVILFIIYVLLAIYMYVVWRSIAYKKVYLKKKSQVYLEHHIKKLSGQSSIIFVYLTLYGTMLIISSVFFFADIHNGITLLFKVTTPINLIIYACGIWFIVIATKQSRKLDLLNKEFDKLELSKKMSNY